MSGNRRFVDTNILVYAHDTSAGGKQERARALVEQLWNTRDGCLSIQILQEFFVSVTRKIPKPLETAAAKEIIADLSLWYVHVPEADDVLGAISLHQQTGISFWDAMMVRSAIEIGCEVIYSEDLNHGQRYDGARVENPFRDETRAGRRPDPGSRHDQGPCSRSSRPPTTSGSLSPGALASSSSPMRSPRWPSGAK
jgi:predicted nucleic acid-binding protein